MASFSKPIPVLLGRNGLAWGRGEISIPRGATMKREGDGRAPAGIFRIGKIYTHDTSLPKGANYPFRTISQWDAWPDDPKNRYYNQHIVIDPKRGVPEWFDSQKMRHGDAAYRWLIEIRHNADPPTPGYGSAIFFHTRRGPTRTTAGCTTMAVSDLVRVIQWLDARAQPRYVLLPKSEYAKSQRSWNLPSLP
ncbi:MAG: L,D-transpeptidase family protein [Verrucomicrobiota bacterium]